MNKKNLLKINLLSIFLVASCTTPNNIPIGSSSPTPTISPSSDNTSVNPNPSSSPNSQSSVSPSVNPTSSPSTGGQVNNSTTLTIPSNFLKLSYNDYYSAELKWSQMTGAKSYKIYQDGKLIADNLTGSIYNVKNLRPNTDYSFDIVAVNDAGESNKSNLKVRTFIPSSNSSSNNYNNNYDNNNGYYPTPTPTPTVAPVLTRLYVNPLSAGGLNNGSTWSNAYTNLQNALRVATSGQEIWVATGIYYTALQNSANRSASFVIPAGVKVYGGFAGNEISLGERFSGQNPSVLSGDFPQDDITNSFNTSAFKIKISDMTENNSYHVVRIENQATNSSTIDGFTIERGYADGGDVKDGGAVYISNSSPIINNVMFNTNFADNNGGAIYNAGTGSFNLTNSSLDNNRSNNNGGAISFASNSGAINITNTSFNRNLATNGNGGAIYIPSMSSSITDDSDIDLVNSTFNMNSATNGGAIYLENTTLNLTNYVFNGNSATNNGGAIYVNNSTLTGKDNSFTLNTAGSQGNIIYSINSTSLASGDQGGNTYGTGPTNNDIVETNVDS